MENNEVPIWERMRRYIDDVAGISRKQLAANLGITESQISLILSGKRALKLEEYVRICKTLSVKTSRFLEDAC